MKRLVLLLTLTFALGIPGESQDDNYIHADRLGIAHISSAADVTTDDRYRQALALGAGWNRWPLYWNWVETAPDQWDWSDYDRQVSQDLLHGFNINAIFLGRPEFYADGGRIQGMHEPIFADGTDIPEANKALNPDNPWARFVHEAVNRYKPGGVLAQQRGIAGGIRVWEVWNEPDTRLFWQGSINDYARLLKISYIVVKQADPSAQVMFGGLIFPSGANWLSQVLNIYVSDPMREQFNWYMDLVAIHNYANPWRSGWLTLTAQQSLFAYGLDRPIWLNETGVSVWNDYPGPLWDPESLWRATTEQQAWFFIQSAVWAWSSGADKVFYHQLFDDCGDQPAGTDFPLHTGELCTGNALCAGDAFGVYRNLSSSTCFSHHPLPGTPRPVAKAYRLMADVFGAEPFSNGERLFLDDRLITIRFERPATKERITVIWNRTLDGATLELEAAGQNAQLISLDGDFMLTPEEDGNYRLLLAPATPDNDPNPPQGSPTSIGGPPVVLIERLSDTVDPLVIDLEAFESPRLVDLIASVPTLPPPRPTVDPARDTEPPFATILELNNVSEPTFRVSWRGKDDSGIERYLIWVRINGGRWQPWIETAQTSADYTGSPGSTYEFAAWAVDLGGNWSSNTELQAQAATRVE